MNLMIAALSGNSLINLLIWVVILGVVYMLGKWLLDTIKLDEPLNKFARGLLVVIVIVFLINALLGLMGKAFVNF